MQNVSLLFLKTADRPTFVPALLVWCLMLVFAPPIHLEAQVYDWQARRGLPIMATGVGMGVSGTIIKRHKPRLTEAEIAALDRADVWRFDRIATHNWSPRAADHSDVFLFGSHALPVVALLALPQSRSEWRSVVPMAAEAYLINAGLTVLTKEIFKRRRAYTYNPNAPLKKKLEADATSSFFSGHVSVVSVNAFFSAAVLTSFTENNHYDPLIWATAAALPAVTAYLRVRAGKHYPSDVIVGYLVGGASGILVPLLHRR